MLWSQMNELKEESGNRAKNAQALRQCVKGLENKTDEIIGSQTYLSAEYNELLQKIKIVEDSLKHTIMTFNNSILIF